MGIINKGKDNFFLHGFVIGLAYLGYMTVIPWWLIVLRAVAMGLFMGIWCQAFENDVMEEMGRGATIAASLIIFI